MSKYNPSKLYILHLHFLKKNTKKETVASLLINNLWKLWKDTEMDLTITIDTQTRSLRRKLS